jgi:predicted lipoprotein
MNRQLLLVLSLLLIFASCKKKDSQSEKPQYDRVSMLTNIGNNIVIPNYLAFHIQADKLDSAITDFNAAPDAIKLTNLQGIFKDTYRSWQVCTVFEFGPASDAFLNLNLNTFPTNVNDINSNIASGTYDLNAASNIDAKGFPGIDYLLFGSAADNNAILALYTSDANATNRKNYLAALSAEIKTKASTVYNAWIPTGGNYINTFLHASGTDNGSSVGYLVNQLSSSEELLKNYKIGIPNGEQSAGTPFPSKVEALYSGISVELAVLQLQSLQNLFLGKSSQGDGPGFDDYANFTGASFNGTILGTAINNQFNSAIAKLQAIPDPLSNSVSNNNATVHAAYLELQQLLVLLKSDMPAALGVLITYNDNDGD